MNSVYPNNKSRGVMTMAKELAKSYNPSEFEDRIYTHLTKHFRTFLSVGEECRATAHFGSPVQTMRQSLQRLKSLRQCVKRVSLKRISAEKNS